MGKGVRVGPIVHAQVSDDISTVLQCPRFVQIVTPHQHVWFRGDDFVEGEDARAAGEEHDVGERVRARPRV